MTLTDTEIRRLLKSKSKPRMTVAQRRELSIIARKERIERIKRNLVLSPSMGFWVE